MATLETDSGELITNSFAGTVELVDALTPEEGDDPATWLPYEFLYCDTLNIRCNTWDVAVLSMELGDNVIQPGSDPDTAHFQNYQPTNLVNKFCRVKIPQESPTPHKYWVGYIIQTTDDRSAVKEFIAPGDPDDGQKRLTGEKQYFVAVGLAWFLDRAQIDTAVVLESIGGSSPYYTRIERPMGFNDDKSINYDNDTVLRGNRHDGTKPDVVDSLEIGGTEDFHLFYIPGAARVRWSATQILGHLLRFHSPLNAADPPLRRPCIFDYLEDDAPVGAHIYPTVPTERRTTLAVLNDTFSPARGLQWWLETLDTEPAEDFRAIIRIASSSSEEITFPDAGTLPANADQQSLDLNEQVDVESIRVAEEADRGYDQIIVRGARLTSTVTFGYPQETLTKDWTSTQETAYRNAAKDTDGYSSLDEDMKAARNDAYRSSDVFNRVFGDFRVPTNWDGTTGNGYAGDKFPALPVLSPSGIVVGGLPLSVNGIRFLNMTRLKEGFDYTSDPANPTGSIPSGSEPVYMKPFALLQLVDSGPTLIWQYVEKLKHHEFAEGELIAEPTVSFHLNALSTTPGIRLSGELMHKIAGPPSPGDGVWDAGDYEPTAEAAELDYRTLLVTATVEADAYCEAKYPATLATDLHPSRPVERLTIYAGERYRLDYMGQKTIWSLESGVPKETAGGVMRDDRSDLGVIARLAYEWYRQAHLPLTVSVKNLRDDWRLGMMITTLGDGSAQKTINTVITEIAIDFNSGKQTITTAHQSVDFQRLVGAV